MRLPHVRFTAWWLMALIGSLALVLGFMRYALSSWSAREVQTVALMVLSATSFLAWLQRARRRAFWGAFSLCGWAYLALALYSPLAEHLPTSRILDGLHDRIGPVPTVPASYDDFEVWADLARERESFVRAGQSLLSLMFALLGSIVASVLYPVRTEDQGVTCPPDGTLLKADWRDGPTGRP